MSHRVAPKKVRLNADCLKLALDWLFQGIDFSAIHFRTDCTWTVQQLLATALLWAWTDEITLVERFQSARSTAQYLFGGSPAGSYQAFVKMLVRWTASLCGPLQMALRRRMFTNLADCRLVAGLCVFGVDGSRVDLPRTLSNQAAYAAARKPKKKQRRSGRASIKKNQASQLWLTTMWHVGCGLPWDWCCGPSDSSERDHLLTMLPRLPEQALIAADAGFVGYRCLAAVLASGRHLLIRVGGNVRLLKGLGYARESSGVVYLWPEKAMRRRVPPLVLRLVESHDGKQSVYLLTDLLSKQLADRQVIELYARRWGVELFYRSLKQTFGRRKLRSATAENARIELDWSLAGLWTLGLYTLVQIQRDGEPPRRLSCAQMLRCLRRTLRDQRNFCPDDRRLTKRLRSALIDDYVRGDRSSREYPRKKQESPPGRPRIIHATAAQKRAAQALRQTKPKIRLTA